jgi:crotonobetainyl-CoA:carnitine CoA-transferase CaiB-like acyl-CoA transferase
VIKVEPPGGSSARRIGPFYEDVPHPDRSLFWWGFNRNKRSITLDLERPEGAAVLRRFAERADMLVESEMPGTLATVGLGYDDLAKLNPRLIYVSITPFGQDGPKASYADADLVILAAGGPLSVTGDADRPPVRVSVPQAYSHAAAEAAGAGLIALHERHRSGLGQHVDVSAQQAVTIATQSNILSAAVGFPELQRVSGGARAGPLTFRFVYPAKDGFVSVTFAFGSSIGRFTRRLMGWIHEEGFCDVATRDKDWIAYTDLLFSGTEPIEELERVKQVLASFTASKTKAELLRAATERDLLIAPVTRIDEVVESEQLAARDYWRNVEHPELGRSFRYPGPFVRCDAKPIAYRLRPPTVGEHNREVYAEYGIDDAELTRLREQGIV